MKSMYKIDRSGKGGGSKNRILGNYRWLCTKLIERGGKEKIATLSNNNDNVHAFGPSK